MWPTAASELLQNSASHFLQLPRYLAPQTLLLYLALPRTGRAASSTQLAALSSHFLILLRAHFPWLKWFNLFVVFLCHLSLLIFCCFLVEFGCISLAVLSFEIKNMELRLSSFTEYLLPKYHTICSIYIIVIFFSQIIPFSSYNPHSCLARYILLSPLYRREIWALYIKLEMGRTVIMIQTQVLTPKTYCP